MDAMEVPMGLGCDGTRRSGSLGSRRSSGFGVSLFGRLGCSLHNGTNQNPTLICYSSLRYPKFIISYYIL